MWTYALNSLFWLTLYKADLYTGLQVTVMQFHNYNPRYHPLGKHFGEKGTYTDYEF